MGSEQAHAINNNMTHIPGHRHAALTPPHTPATTAPAVDGQARPRRRRARRPHLRRSLARPLPAAAHRRPLRHVGGCTLHPRGERWPDAMGGQANVWLFWPERLAGFHPNVWQKRTFGNLKAKRSHFYIFGVFLTSKRSPNVWQFQTFGRPNVWYRTFGNVVPCMLHQIINTEHDAKVAEVAEVAQSPETCFRR